VCLTMGVRVYEEVNREREFQTLSTKVSGAY